LIIPLPAIGITPSLEALMHAHHAFERRPRIKASAAAGGESDALHSRALKPD